MPWCLECNSLIDNSLCLKTEFLPAVLTVDSAEDLTIGQADDIILFKVQVYVIAYRPLEI